MKKIITLCIALLFAGMPQVFAQSGYEVKGVVTDSYGPVIGATVMEAGTSVGTSTDVDGSFTLKVSSEDAVVEVSCLGYATRTFKALELPSEISLSQDAEYLEEAVAIGYGSQKKKEVTGSVASIKSEDFNVGVKTNPVGLLQGKVAGLNISRTTADPTETGFNVQIRGFSTL
ncbi:MAG: carboxypeptidase-like regulatory domain-containing protein, partial [Candidatus Cryptobacteroides sp.]